MKPPGIPIVAACVLLAVTACTSPASPTPPATAEAANVFAGAPEGTLRISGFNPSDEVGESRATYAAGKLSGIDISLDTTNFDPQKFAAQSAAGQTPDLVQMERNTVATFAAKDLLLPLDQCFAAHQVTPTDQYYPSAIADVSYQNSPYAVPQFYQASALLADKRVLEKSGVTAADLDTSKPEKVLAAASKMYQESGGKPSVLGFDADIPGSTTIWLNVFGGRVYNEDGSPALDLPENLAALTWLKQLTDAQGGYSKLKSFKDTMDVFGAENQYVKDQVGVQTWAQWYPNVLSDTANQVSIEAIPIRDAGGTVIAMAGGTAFAIPKAGKNPAAACAWAIAATSTPAWMAAGEARAKTVAAKKSIATGLMTGSPAADQAIRKSYVKPSGNADFDQVIDTYYSILPDNKPMGSSPVGQQVNQELENAVIVALTGEKTPEQALADAQAAAQRAWDQVRR